MVSRVSTVAFQGIEGVPVDVQLMVGPGKINMQLVRWINHDGLNECPSGKK